MCNSKSIDASAISVSYNDLKLWYSFPQTRTANCRCSYVITHCVHTSMIIVTDLNTQECWLYQLSRDMFWETNNIVCNKMSPKLIMSAGELWYNKRFGSTKADTICSLYGKNSLYWGLPDRSRQNRSPIKPFFVWTFPFNWVRCIEAYLCQFATPCLLWCIAYGVSTREIRNAVCLQVTDAWHDLCLWTIYAQIVGVLLSHAWKVCSFPTITMQPDTNESTGSEKTHETKKL